jgi:hypothetical protein
MLNHLVILILFQVPSVEVNALMRTMKIKPLMFPVQYSFSGLFWVLQALCRHISFSPTGNWIGLFWRNCLVILGHIIIVITVGFQDDLC